MGGNQFVRYLKKFWGFLGEDSWSSLIVCLILAFILIKFIFLPFLSFVTGTTAPLLIVESCSMYHSRDLPEIMKDPAYVKFNLTLDDTEDWDFKRGINKGDIVFILGAKNVEAGDVIIFNVNGKITRTPIIHRAISTDPISTKGDNNKQQLSASNNVRGIDETNIKQEQIVGKAVFRVPYLGWVKLVFFEPFRIQDNRGFC